MQEWGVFTDVAASKSVWGLLKGDKTRRGTGVVVLMWGKTPAPSRVSPKCRVKPPYGHDTVPRRGIDSKPRRGVAFTLDPEDGDSVGLRGKQRHALVRLTT